MVQLMPLPLIVSCFSKIQIGFTFLVWAHLGSPRQRAVKWVLYCDRRLHSRGLEVKCGTTKLPIYKGKGYSMSVDRGIKLLEHAMKVVERIFQYKIWQQIEIDDIQFGFMKSKGKSHAFFIVG